MCCACKQKPAYELLLSDWMSDVCSSDLNAGKSSALNARGQQNALARVSKAPGRTQQLVFFDGTAGSGGAADAAPGDARYLVDLPGYGYAKVPKDLQAHWQAFLDGYFGSRMALRGLVVVMDIRHPLKDYDR